jgi:hypothetical protein
MNKLPVPAKLIEVSKTYTDYIATVNLYIRTSAKVICVGLDIDEARELGQNLLKEVRALARLGKPINA